MGMPGMPVTAARSWQWGLGSSLPPKSSSNSPPGQLLCSANEEVAEIGFGMLGVGQRRLFFNS